MKTKKQLKQSYKALKPAMGVYQILNSTTKMRLIEGSTNMTAKWNRHRTELRFGSHRNKVLQKDWNELGEESFIFSVLATYEEDKTIVVDVREEIKLLEVMTLEELDIKQADRY